MLAHISVLTFPRSRWVDQWLLRDRSSHRRVGILKWLFMRPILVQGERPQWLVVDVVPQGLYACEVSLLPADRSRTIAKP